MHLALQKQCFLRVRRCANKLAIGTGRHKIFGGPEHNFDPFRSLKNALDRGTNEDKNSIRMPCVKITPTSCSKVRTAITLEGTDGTGTVALTHIWGLLFPSNCNSLDEAQSVCVLGPREHLQVRVPMQLRNAFSFRSFYISYRHKTCL